ncbi:unnamed protein product [Arctia plantaginis]|uniref:Fatty acyl-CoA reductase n=1 Tax=Arctia plantaginis TaxID=874455 RepID=A0A8S0ZI64_ARCPL|nr:unnamed protein product [Arctia plantaginis]
MVPRPAPRSTPPPLIPEFYAGRELFITGATGFMGKVLVERLLWTCQEISKLHLLMRPKKDVSPEKRLKQLKQSQVFDVIRERCPKQLEKLSIVAGDITQPKLGLNKDTIQRLRKVSVVFHSAAIVKFDEMLDVAVEQNLKSVLKVMDFCDQLPMIQVMVYISTAYSNADIPNIEECVYTTQMNPHQLMSIVDNLSKEALTAVTPSLISPKPNTYTFTKAMAESAVAERALAAKYATAIFRPSIVVSSLQNPFPGWIENLNGPSGITVSAGKGLLHVIHCSGNKRADMIPVDIAIDTLIAVAWETGIDKCRETRVYNCCSYDNPTTWGEFKVGMLHNVRKYPFDTPLWYPFGFFTENKFVLTVAQWLLQVVPLHSIDFLCNMFGIKTSLNLATISKRLRTMSKSLQFFMTNEWKFNTDNVRRLRERLTPADSAILNLDVSAIDWNDHCEKFIQGTRRYLLKEKDEDIERAHSRMRLLHILHRLVQFVIALFLCWLVLHLPTRLTVF